MARLERLLDRAYDLIEDGRRADAGPVLDAVVTSDPHNIEAWELYVQISDNRADLDRLARRVRFNRDLTAGEKKEILAYQAYILSHLENRRANVEREDRPDSGSGAALSILGAIFVAAVILWLMVAEVRTTLAFYFLLAFIVGLALWFRRSDQTNEWAGSRNYSYRISTPRLIEGDRPELYLYDPIIKVGPLPEDD